MWRYKSTWSTNLVPDLKSFDLLCFSPIKLDTWLISKMRTRCCCALAKPSCIWSYAYLQGNFRTLRIFMFWIQNDVSSYKFMVEAWCRWRDETMFYIRAEYSCYYNMIPPGVVTDSSASVTSTVDDAWQWVGVWVLYHGKPQFTGVKHTQWDGGTEHVMLNTTYLTVLEWPSALQRKMPEESLRADFHTKFTVNSTAVQYSCWYFRFCMAPLSILLYPLSFLFSAV